MVTATSDTAFDNDILKSKGYVLVDFWAEWCGPCRQLMPIVEGLATDKANKLKVYKLNIEENPDTPAKLGIRGIPTLILFKDGKEVAKKVGSLPKESLYQWVDSQTAN